MGFDLSGSLSVKDKIVFNIESANSPMAESKIQKIGDALMSWYKSDEDAVRTFLFLAGYALDEIEKAVGYDHGDEYFTKNVNDFWYSYARNEIDSNVRNAIETAIVAAKPANYTAVDVYVIIDKVLGLR